MSRDESGSAIVEFTWLGLLLLIPLVYAVLALFEVQQASFALTGATRAAGRAYVLADSDAEGQARARQVVDQVLADHGLADQDYQLVITCAPRPTDCHSGDSVVTVRINAEVAVPLIPAIGGHYPAIDLRARQDYPVGQFEEIS